MWGNDPPLILAELDPNPPILCCAYAVRPHGPSLHRAIKVEIRYKHMLILHLAYRLRATRRHTRKGP